MVITYFCSLNSSSILIRDYVSFNSLKICLNTSLVSIFVYFVHFGPYFFLNVQKGHNFVNYGQFAPFYRYCFNC